MCTVRHSSLSAMRRSPDWICPQCNRPNRECLPITESKQTSASSSSGLECSAGNETSPNLHSVPAAEGEAKQEHVNAIETNAQDERQRETGDTSCGPQREAGVTHLQNAAASGLAGSDRDLSPAEGRPAAVAPLRAQLPASSSSTVATTSRSSSSSLALLRKRMADDTVGVALDAMISVLVAIAAAIAMRKFVF